MQIDFERSFEAIAEAMVSSHPQEIVARHGEISP